MDARLIHYFVTVVKKKSFTDAAKHLHISQPSLSTAIKNLEDRIGFKLLNRSTRKISLTEEGLVFYNEASRLMTHFNYLETEAKRLKEKGLPHLKIAMIESVNSWLSDILSTFSHTHTDIHISLYEILSASNIKKALYNFEVDFAITNQMISDPSIQSIQLYKEAHVILISKDHHLSQADSLRLDDFKHEPLIMFKEGFQTRKDTLAAFRQHGFEPLIKYEVERLDTAVSLVEKNLACVIIPEEFARKQASRQLVIKEITDFELSRYISLLFLSNRHLDSSTKHFISLISEYFNHSFHD